MQPAAVHVSLSLPPLSLSHTYKCARTHTQLPSDTQAISPLRSPETKTLTADSQGLQKRENSLESLSVCLSASICLSLFFSLSLSLSLSLFPPLCHPFPCTSLLSTSDASFNKALSSSHTLLLFPCMVRDSR